MTTAVIAVGFAVPAHSARAVPTIVFPLIGDVAVDDNYGDPRGNGAHAGIDLMAPRRMAVVAAEDGRVEWWTTSSRAGCMLYLYGKSGTTYLYIHLNNDRTLGNDNQAGCVAGLTYSVPDGAKVTAGQQIALNGDSGDADGNPHLHFEVHPDGGRDTNPYSHLVRATRILFPARTGQAFSLGLRGTPISAGAGRLTLRATSVRWWPGGQWTTIKPRLIELGVKPDGAIDADLAEAIKAPTLSVFDPSLVEKRTYSAFTGSAKATPAAQRGEPGALTVARLTRPGGPTVSLGPAVEPAPTTESTETETDAFGWVPNWVDWP